MKKVPISLRIKHESEPEQTFECKDCGSEISKYEYENNNALCSSCLKDLYNDFGGED